MDRIFPDNDDEDDVDWESQVAIKIFKCTSLQVMNIQRGLEKHGALLEV